MKNIALPLLSALALIACGGSSNSSSQPAIFNLGISDAPVDSADEVVLYFNEVVLVPSGGGDSILIDVQQEGVSGRIDLLDFQGSSQASLIDALEVPAGEYTLCLYALDGDGSTDSSYVDHQDQGIVPLKVNSKGSCSGVTGNTDNAGRIFFNQPFTINQGQNNFVAEFDLRKGLVDPKGQAGFFIKPTAVQLINQIESGSLTGLIDANLMNSCISDSVTQSTDGSFSHAIYLFQNEIPLEQMGDIDNERDSFVQPFAIAPLETVEIDGESRHQYEFGFVSEGTYSLAYTCLAQNDLAESDDLGELEGQISFYHSQGPVTVEAQQVSEVDLGAM